MLGRCNCQALRALADRREGNQKLQALLEDFRLSCVFVLQFQAVAVVSLPKFAQSLGANHANCVEELDDEKQQLAQQKEAQAGVIPQFLQAWQAPSSVSERERERERERGRGRGRGREREAGALPRLPEPGKSFGNWK